MGTEFGAREDSYAEIAELYDLEHGEYADDVELYLRLADVVGDPVLELGCGTGRILVPFASAGYRVTGLDRSRPMLDRAEAALRNLGRNDRAALVAASFTEADQAPGGPFGLVLFSLNGLMHLSSPVEQRAALAAARRALDPRGMLVIDTMNPTPDVLARFDGRVEHEGAWQRSDGTRIDRFSSRVLASAAQRFQTELWYDIVDANGQLRRIRTSFAMRYVAAAELELLLELAGFVEWKLYGSYDLDPYDDTSERLIATAEVMPS